MSKISSEEYDFYVKKSGDDDSAYVAIGCIMEASGILKKGVREVSADKCRRIGSEEEKSLGKIKHADGSIKYFFDPADTAGKKILNDAFEDGTTKLTIKIVLDDMGATSATTVTRDVLVKSIDIVDDSSWKEEVTLEFVGKPTFEVAS